MSVSEGPFLFMSVSEGPFSWLCFLRTSATTSRCLDGTSLAVNIEMQGVRASHSVWQPSLYFQEDLYPSPLNCKWIQKLEGRLWSHISPFEDFQSVLFSIHQPLSSGRMAASKSHPFWGFHDLMDFSVAAPGQAWLVTSHLPAFTSWNFMHHSSLLLSPLS